MNKIRVTKKEIRESGAKIISVGYCDLQFLLNFRYADFYSCGIYGWSCDYYKIDDNVIICTGYSPIGNINPDYKLIRKTEQKAREIYCNNDYKIAKPKIEKLLKSFIKKAIEG